MKTLPFALLLLVGCAGGPRYAPGERYMQELRAWRGRDINELIALQGPPTEVFRAPNGDTLFTWAVQGPVRYSGYSYHGISSGSASQRHCRTTFTVGGDGRIGRILTEGDICTVPVAPRQAPAAKVDGRIDA